MRAPAGLGRCHTIADVRDRARRSLPRPVFDFLDGAAETELTARRNTEIFDDVHLVPRCLVDVAAVRTQTRILGQNIDWPVICSPTGASRLFHREGELAVARAAADAGVFYTLSTGSTHSIEDVASACAGPKMFQLYLFRDRELTHELIERCRRAGYAALCLTVDVPAVGKRERDLRSRFTTRPRWSWRSLRDYGAHPVWTAERLRPLTLSMASFPRGTAASKLVEQLDPSVTWRDLRDLIERWGGPFALKGVMSVEDARHAAECGVSALIISNHGGRQLDGAATPLEVLPDMVRAVGDRIELILDGGIRRGVHILKGLALGAKACSIGRPYLYGLSAGGEAGVARVLHILRSELVLAMQLSGCSDLHDLSREMVRWQP